jgi:hypothetical protein
MSDWVDKVMFVMVASIFVALAILFYAAYQASIAPKFSLTKSEWVCVDHKTRTTWVGKTPVITQECTNYVKR